MTFLSDLIAALHRIATALEQLAPAVTQAAREANQTRVREGRAPSPKTDWPNQETSN